MDIFIDIALLVVGFVLLIKGADFFVDGASSLAKKLRVPSLIVGLTIVALGTSTPELAVSITASAGGQNSMAVSNVIGSNIFNLLVVLGVCSLIAPLGDKQVGANDTYGDPFRKSGEPCFESAFHKGRRGISPNLPRRKHLGAVLSENFGHSHNAYDGR